MTAMRVRVVTVVHTPLDARIHNRQIRALVAAGHDVVFAAPFAAAQVDPASVGVTTVDLPRATGRTRLGALRAARRLLRTRGAEFDVVLVHDPELLLAVGALPASVPVVWDVHEDLGASLADKAWLPPWLARLVRWSVRRMEARAERRHHLLLAESGYAERFDRDHPVVPNLPWLPDEPTGPTSDRVVYLGRVSRLRGAQDLVEVGRELRAQGLTLEVVGPVDADMRPVVDAAADRGDLVVHGFVPNEQAVRLLDGALAGLSLLHDHPNYRHSLPTKVAEYQASAVPVVTTPLPSAVDMVTAAGSGVVVPFEDPRAAVDAVLALQRDRARARSLGAAGRRDATSGNSWDAQAPRFVAELERAARNAG